MFLFICIICFLYCWDGFEIFQSALLGGFFFTFELVSFFLSCYFIDCIFRCVVSGLSQNVSVQWKFSKVCRLLESVDRYHFILFFSVYLLRMSRKIMHLIVCFFLIHFSGRALSRYSVVNSRRMGIFEQQQVVILYIFL